MSDSAISPDAPLGASGRPTLSELFLAFVTVSVSGFGGALPWAQRMLVERKRWMTAEEFNEAFALSQFLPGPNVVNFSVVFGTRFAGTAGAAVALAGLMGPHIARLAGFHRAGMQLAASAIIGGLILLVADWLGRNIIFPFQIPAGLFATMVGGPFLLVLIARRG